MTGRFLVMPAGDYRWLVFLVAAVLAAALVAVVIIGTEAVLRSRLLLREIRADYEEPPAIAELQQAVTELRQAAAELLRQPGRHSGPMQAVPAAEVAAARRIRFPASGNEWFEDGPADTGILPGGTVGRPGERRPGHPALAMRPQAGPVEPALA